LKTVLFPPPLEKEIYLVRQLQLSAHNTFGKAQDVALYEYKIVTPTKDFYICIFPRLHNINDLQLDENAQLKMLKLSNSIVHCNLSRSTDGTCLDLTNELRKFVLYFDHNNVTMDQFLKYIYAIHSSNECVKLFDKMYVYLNDDEFSECSYHVSELKSVTFPDFIRHNLLFDI
jgi:hypothetical protein